MSQHTKGQSLAQRVNDLHEKAGMPLDQARELALSEAGVTADNQWFGDMMILQVLADSDHVNDQEREVLTRWLAASQPPDVHMRGATRPCDLGVGCDEAGVCYAEAHGQPEQCPHSSAGVKTVDGSRP